MTFFNDRRKLDANGLINLFVCRGIVSIALMLTAGAIYLHASGLPAPDWIGNAVISIAGGLIGYLSRDPKHSASVSTENVETMNVESEKTDTPKDESP